MKDVGDDKVHQFKKEMDEVLEELKQVYITISNLRKENQELKEKLKQKDKD